MWTYEHSVETDAPPDAIWAVYADCAGWPEWNAGIGRLDLDGPFTAGTGGMLTPRGQEPLPFRIVEADPRTGYTSETAIAETVTMRTTNTFHRLDGGGTRLVQHLSMHGPAAEFFGRSFGPAFAAGVPPTMAALVLRAQELPIR
jgi:Polyketide cyclase / dehydrase and lipid transport